MSHTIDAPGSGSGDALTSVGAGTLNYIPLWTPDGSTIGDSALDQDATTAGVLTLANKNYTMAQSVTATDIDLLLDNTTDGKSVTIRLDVSEIGGDRTQTLTDASGNIAVYSDTFASGTIPLLGDGAGGGVTGELSNSLLTQEDANTIRLTGSAGEKIQFNSTLHYIERPAGTNRLIFVSGGNEHFRTTGSSTEFDRNVVINATRYLTISNTAILSMSDGTYTHNIISPQNLTASRSSYLPDVGGDIVVYTDTFASGTIPLLGDGAGTGVTGEISNSNLVQDASGDINLGSGKHHLVTGSTAGYFVTDTNNGIINYSANNWGLLHNGNVHIQFLSNDTRFSAGKEVRFYNTAETGNFLFDFADTPATGNAGSLKGSNLSSITGVLQLPELARNSTIDIIKEEATEALTVANSTVSSGALTANTTYEVTTVGSGGTNSHTVTSVNGTTGPTLEQADLETLGTVFKTNGSPPTPDYTGGLVLTPVLPPYGNVIEITSDNATAANRTRNFPANTTVPNGHEITVYLSGGSNKALIEGVTLDADASPEDNIATFIRIGGSWQCNGSPHQASDGT